jgi:hypothetical protein
MGAPTTRSTTSEYQPASPASRLSGKAAFSRGSDTTGDDAPDKGLGAVISSSSSKAVAKSNKSGSPPLASGNKASTGSRGIQK